MKDIEKQNIPTGKEKSKKGPDTSFDKIKKAVDQIKQAEASETQQDQKVLNALEQELQAHESHAWGWSKPGKQTRIQKKITRYQQTIRAWMVRHPERPPEVGQAALSVIETIATSDENPNIIAKSIGKIMKLILQL